MLFLIIHVKKNMWIKNICLLCFLCKTNCTTVNCQEIWICNCNTDLMRVWAIFAQMSDVSFCLLFSKNAHYIHFHINHQIKHFIVYMLFLKLRKYFFELYFLTFFTSDLVKSIIFPQYMYQIFFFKNYVCENYFEFILWVHLFVCPFVGR